VGGYLNVPMRGDVLRRVRETAPQTGLGRSDRRSNLRAAFAAQDGLRGRRVMLVDDVMSTGTTAA